MLLPCWALDAGPVYLLVALQRGIVRIIVISSIVLMIPWCQESCHLRVPALCKSWLLGVLGALELCALQAATVVVDPGINAYCPLVAIGITEPSKNLTPLCNHTVSSTIVLFVTPLSCNCGSFGS